MLIACSPRSNGNSDYLFCLAKNIYPSADTLMLRNENLSGCIGCDSCLTTGECYKSDNTTDILNKMTAYDKIVLFCPVYFCGFDSHTKALIDRSQYLYNHSGKISGRIALVTVYAQNSDKIPFGLDYGMRFFAEALKKEYYGMLSFKGVDAKGEIRDKNPEIGLKEFLKNF